MPETSYLSKRQISTLWDAADYANHLNRPLSTFITLVWQFVGINDQTKADKAFAAFTAKLRPWLIAKTGGYYAVWVAENSPDRGYHHHLLAHAPREITPKLREAAKAWLPKRRHPQKAHALDIRLPWVNVNPIKAQYGQLRYISKAMDYSAEMVDRETGEVFNLASWLGVKPKEGKALTGLVLGKRCGASESLGALIRSHAEFPSRFECFA